MRFQQQKLKELKRHVSEEQYWKYYAQICKADEWFLVRDTFNWGWLDENLLAEDLLGFYHKHEREDTAVFISRGHGKTLIEMARVVRRIINNPHTAILYASATEPLANDFGKTVGQILLGNTKLRNAFPRIIPKSANDCERWGKDGYELPNRRPRIDPTLACISIQSNRTGYHPDEAFVDDLVVLQNNNPTGWAKAEAFIQNLIMLLPPDGVMHITGTRWGDGDPYGKIIRGAICGKSGRPFNVLIRSCWQDDNPAKPPTYPRKIRWNMDHESGYTHEQLLAMRRPPEEGGLGVFFDAQMRNDPAPEDRQPIKINYINRYGSEELAKLLPVSQPRAFGVEVTGGGRVIFSALREKAEKLRFNLPLIEVTQTRTQGETKADKILASLEPVVSSGHLWCQEWMLRDPDTPGTLGYELKRLGVGLNDDIADALHCIVTHLAGKVAPAEGERPHLYLHADLAWTEKKRGDWTVTMAVAVDRQSNFWVLDYDRFQLESPSGICDRLIEFYRKWSGDAEERAHSSRRGRLAMSYR